MRVGAGRGLRSARARVRADFVGLSSSYTHRLALQVSTTARIAVSRWDCGMEPF